MALPTAPPQGLSNLPNVTIRCLPNPETLSQFASTSLYIPQPSTYTFADLFDDLALGFKNVAEDANSNSFASSIALGRFESEQPSFTIVTREDPSTLAAPVTPGIYYIFRHEQRLCSFSGAGAWHRIPQHPPALAGEAHCCRHVALLAKGASPSIVVSDSDVESPRRQPLRICTNFPNLGVLPDIDLEESSPQTDSRSSAFLSAISLRDGSCLLTGDSDFEAANIVPFRGEDHWTSEMQNAAWMERNRIGFAQTHEYGPEEITSFCVENGFAVRKDLRRDFDKFLWSVNPKTFRIRVFAAQSYLLPFHNQPIFRQQSTLSSTSPSAFPPSAVWEWHYNQCILHCLHNRSACYVAPMQDNASIWSSAHNVDDSDSAIADDEDSDEEEDCLCYSPTTPSLGPPQFARCPHHGNGGASRHRSGLSISSNGSLGVPNAPCPESFPSKRALTWDSTFSDGEDDQVMVDN